MKKLSAAWGFALAVAGAATSAEVLKGAFPLSEGAKSVSFLIPFLGGICLFILTAIVVHLEEARRSALYRVKAWIYCCVTLLVFGASTGTALVLQKSAIFYADLFCIVVVMIFIMHLQNLHDKHPSFTPPSE
jgi:hypothetical protein